MKKVQSPATSAAVLVLFVFWIKYEHEKPVFPCVSGLPCFLCLFPADISGDVGGGPGLVGDNIPSPVGRVTPVSIRKTKGRFFGWILVGGLDGRTGFSCLSWAGGSWQGWHGDGVVAGQDGGGRRSSVLSGAGRRREGRSGKAVLHGRYRRNRWRMSEPEQRISTVPDCSGYRSAHKPPYFLTSSPIWNSGTEK